MSSSGQGSDRRWPAWPRRMSVVVATILVGIGSSRAADREPTASPPGPQPAIGAAYRNGSWGAFIIRTPEAAAGPVRGWIEDPDGQWVGSPASHVTPATHGGDAWLSLRPGRPAARIRIESPPGNGLAAAGPTITIAGEVSSTTPLLLVIGKLPATAAAARLVAGDDRPPMVVTFDKARDRLQGPRDLDGFEAAVVCGSEVGRLPDSALDAIDRWVREGGRLVFAAGASAAAIAADESPAARWLPGAGPRLVPLKRWGALEAYARAGGLTARVPPAGIDVPRFDSGNVSFGMVDAFEGTTAADLPLVVRRAHGLGTITWIGVDVDAAWCAAWPGCDRLLAALLGGREEPETAAASAEVARGIPDLAGQLRVALDSFKTPGSSSRPVPFEIIAALGVLYAVALYPVDWWLVSRSGRPWLSWLSLPLLAGGFTALTWSVGGLWGRDARAAAQVAEVIDFDAEGGLVRGCSWAAVRSPVNARLNVGVAAEPSVVAAEAHAAVSWFADAGAGFGGVDALVAHPSLAAGDYAYGDTLASLVSVPIAAASSRLFEASWTGTAARSIVDSTLVRDPRGLLTGTISHQLPFPLERCWLVHAGWLYDVGRMAPGDIYDTQQGRGPRSLTAALTRRTAKWEADRTERWDTGDGDVARILELAGLHAAAGGRGYTSLAAGRLGRIDLSPLLLVDRAILVGRTTAARGTAWRLELGAGEGGGGPPPHMLEPQPVDSGSLVRIAIPLPAAGPGNTP